MQRDSGSLMRQSNRTVCGLAMLLPLLWLCGASAAGQLPCRYELTIIYPPPPCQFSPPRTLGAYGISPNGRWVVGVYGQCKIYGESFLYDTQTGELFTLPRPPGRPRVRGGGSE